MTALVAVIAVVGAAAVLAGVVDWRDRRHGAARRSIRDLSAEATHHRVDIDAVPYEPARHAGQRDWATYRRRDRKRGR
jgi:hypothetical protein